MHLKLDFAFAAAGRSTHAVQQSCPSMSALLLAGVFIHCFVSNGSHCNSESFYTKVHNGNVMCPPVAGYEG